MGKPSRLKPSAIGRVTARKLSKRPEGPKFEQRRYTWRPGRWATKVLPKGFRLEMDALVGTDGSLRFKPADGLHAFILKASLGGQAVLEATRGKDPEQSFSYNVMRLIYQHAPLSRECFSRRFLRVQDLLIAAPSRFGLEGDVLPSGLGADARGEGRWSVAELMRRGQEAAGDGGGSDPPPERVIAAGLLAGARIDPIDPATISEDEARVLIRLALFDLGPGATVDAVSKEAVTRRLLEAGNDRLKRKRALPHF